MVLAFKERASVISRWSFPCRQLPRSRFPDPKEGTAGCRPPPFSCAHPTGKKLSGQAVTDVHPTGQNSMQGLDNQQRGFVFNDVSVGLAARARFDTSPRHGPIESGPENPFLGPKLFEQVDPASSSQADIYNRRVNKCLFQTNQGLGRVAGLAELLHIRLALDLSSYPFADDRTTAPRSDLWIFDGRVVLGKGLVARVVFGGSIMPHIGEKGPLVSFSKPPVPFFPATFHHGPPFFSGN